MARRRFTNKQQLVAGAIAAAVVVLGIGGWLVWQLYGSGIPMYTYEHVNFSIEVPKATTVTADVNRVKFLAVPEDRKNQLSQLEDTAQIFGLQVFCDERSTGLDAIAMADDEYAQNKAIVGNQKITRYEKTIIGSNPARVFEYENNVHQVVAAIIQTENRTCLESVYLPKNNPGKWRSVANKSLYSLKIK